MAVKIFIVGLGGYMGKVTAAYCEHDARFEVVGGLDAFADPQTSPYPLFKSAAEVNLEYDAIIDFSNPAVLPELKVLAERDKKALVIATTGYSEEQKRERDAMSDTIPLFTSANMSLGINLLSRLAQDAAKVLYPEFDIEIMEAHHRRKLDAPSGTALFLADRINAALDGRLEYCTERASRREARPQQELGLSSIRGGTIVGEHDIIFAGEDEVISLKHSAGSRHVFAAGAAAAAAFLADKPAGHYSMDDLLSEILKSHT